MKALKGRDSMASGRKGRVVRCATFVTLGILSILLAGCATLKEKKASWFGGGAKKSPATFEASPPPPDPLGSSPTASLNAGRMNGILAGRVIDSFNQHRPGTIIQVAAVEDRGREEAMEVSANSEGYFMVQGLSPGKKYRLGARAKRGDQVLGGTTIATPPNVVLVIKVSEDLPAPKPLSRAGGRRSEQPPSAAAGRPAREQASSEQGWTPDAAPKYLYEPDRGARAPTKAEGDPRARLNPPAAPERSPANQEPLPPIRPEYQTLGPGIAASNPPRAVLPPAEYGRTQESPAPATVNGGSPSCTVTGNRLVDFTLNDLSGQPFRFSEHRGRLVLIDLWGSWCTACMHGLPYLVDLQRRYGAQGLEIVGIAYEDGREKERIDRVNFVRSRQGINYKLLLGEGDSCPVLKRLQVKEFPTLLLVDERGEIVWRCEGLTPQAKARLEAEIRARLLGN